ncbi:MAG: hypothetical protein NTY38_22850 [Acidobacteria bacterium]|nr:hypothetical protein [Acidobacteriota bacterium]
MAVLSESVTVLEGVWQADQKNTTVASNLIYAFRRLGDACGGLGREAESLDYYRRALRISESLPAISRSYATLTTLVETLRQYGLALARHGDRVGALEHVRKALPLCRQLAASDSSAMRNLAWVPQSHAWLGRTYRMPASVGTTGGRRGRRSGKVWRSGKCCRATPDLRSGQTR